MARLGGATYLASSLRSTSVADKTTSRSLPQRRTGGAGELPQQPRAECPGQKSHLVTPIIAQRSNRSETLSWPPPEAPQQRSREHFLARQRRQLSCPLRLPAQEFRRVPLAPGPGPYRDPDETPRIPSLPEPLGPPGWTSPSPNSRAVHRSRTHVESPKWSTYGCNPTNNPSVFVMAKP